MTMDFYIKEQPRVLAAILENRERNTAAFVQTWQTHRPDRVYLVASGTSRNAAATAAPFWEEVLGVETTVCPPTALPPIRGSSPLVVFISQGGNSNNTLAALEQLSACPRFVLTGSAESRMAKLYPYTLIECGPENVGPKTKGYTSTVLILQLMAVEAALAAGSLGGEKAEAYLSALRAAIGHMEENIRRGEGWLKANGDALKTLEKVFLAVEDRGLPVAAEAALKILETLLIPATAFAFEEYLHGPICALEERMGGLYFLPAARREAPSRIQTLAAFHQSLSPLAYTIGPEAPGQDPRHCGLLTTGYWYTGAYEWVLPCQLISAALPGPMGVEGRGHKLYLTVSEMLNVKFEGGA